MKKLMFAISLAGLLGLGASAAVQSANTFGVLKVASTMKQTIISVPWVEVGTGGDIAVSNLVMTSNLTAGDMLYYYDKMSSKYKAWELEENAGVKSWKAPILVDSIGATSSGDAGEQTAVRGDALILVRPNAHTSPIFLYGQYSPSPVTTQTMQLNAWNLIAPPDPSSSGFDLNGVAWLNVDANDFIVLHASNGNAITLKYNTTEEKWGTKFGPTWNYDVATIQAGMGAWYISKASSGEAPKYQPKGI